MLPEILKKFMFDLQYALESGEERACGEKNKFPTMNLATLAAYRMEQLKNEEFEPYACPYCKFYHIGHTRGERSLAYKIGKALR